MAREAFVVAALLLGMTGVAHATGTPAPVLTAALYDRFSSRAEGEFAHRVLSAMRHQFGGHVEKPAG